MFVLNECGTILPSREFLSGEDENVYLHIYYTANITVVNYFGTQIPEIEKN